MKIIDQKFSSKMLIILLLAVALQTSCNSKRNAKVIPPAQTTTTEEKIVVPEEDKKPESENPKNDKRPEKASDLDKDVDPITVDSSKNPEKESPTEKTAVKTFEQQCADVKNNINMLLKNASLSEGSFTAKETIYSNIPDIVSLRSALIEEELLQLYFGIALLASELDGTEEDAGDVSTRELVSAKSLAKNIRIIRKNPASTSTNPVSNNPILSKLVIRANNSSKITLSIPVLEKKDWVQIKKLTDLKSKISSLDVASVKLIKVVLDLTLKKTIDVFSLRPLSAEALSETPPAKSKKVKKVSQGNSLMGELVQIESISLPALGANKAWKLNFDRSGSMFLSIKTESHELAAVKGALLNQFQANFQEQLGDKNLLSKAWLFNLVSSQMIQLNLKSAKELKVLSTNKVPLLQTNLFKVASQYLMFLKNEPSGPIPAQTDVSSTQFFQVNHWHLDRLFLESFAPACLNPVANNAADQATSMNSIIPDDEKIIEGLMKSATSVIPAEHKKAKKAQKKINTQSVLWELKLKNVPRNNSNSNTI